MIAHIKKDIPKKDFDQMVADYGAMHFQENGHIVVITSSSEKTLKDQYTKYVEKSFPMDTDIQLASKNYTTALREIKIADTVIGGNTKNTIFISGPCSVESPEQIDIVAKKLVSLGIKVLRAGCFKPRTSPYTFQGLGLDGLKLLEEVREKYGLKIITEVRDSTHVDDVIERADMIQIGAKAMYDHGILKACGKTQKPVLLKRGFGTTLQEFVQGAEFILSGGNPNVILCERGIRTFETKTRFTLDLCGVAFLKQHVNLPIVVDTSHAIGYAYGVPDLTRASIAMGIDGLLIESHPNPKVAKSDASQQLTMEEMEALHKSLKPVAEAIGYKLV
jgi:3-deoxy-7-phosphoheptulonate synthase